MDGRRVTDSWGFTYSILSPNLVLGLDGAASVAMKVALFWAGDASGAMHWESVINTSTTTTSLTVGKGSRGCFAIMTPNIGILRPNLLLGPDGVANVAMSVILFWTGNACTIKIT